MSTTKLKIENDFLPTHLFRKIALICFTTFAAIAMLAQPAIAKIQYLRWTAEQDQNADIAHIIESMNKQLGLQISTSDFYLIEDRDLATSHFQTYFQTSADIPIKETALRIWSDLNNHKTIQVEIFVEDTPPSQPGFLSLGRNSIISSLAKGQDHLKLVRSWLRKNAEDKKIKSIKSAYFWMGSILVKEFQIKARLGTHVFTVDVKNNKILKHQYKEFPNADNADDEFEIPAQVYQIYDYSDSDDGSLGKQQPLIASKLKFLKKKYHRVDADPYGALRNKKYYDTNQDSFLASTPWGQAQGYWSDIQIKQQGQTIFNSLPTTDNSLAQGGLVLEGRYATINIHPEFAESLSVHAPFEMRHSAPLYMSWKPVLTANEDLYVMTPGSAYLGKPITSLEEVWNRPGVLHADNDPITYLSEGFDEIQVYSGITTLFESLHGMGFTDPELSTRPFHAFLYDPDISSRDNAYYTSDTINFTTYSPGHRNFARDNSTIWHELGHGVMDRLMGDFITLADTGGLSEGMADFVAALVTADVTNNQPFDGSETFRINNRTGFGLTNEVHDDGESYGGAMKDLLDAAIEKMGRDGLVKVGDLTMETMRLTRNHPALTAQDWFSHMLFADQQGRQGVRAPNELHDIIISALDGRNFRFEGTGAAEFSLKNGDQEIVAGSPGSRNRPLQAVFNNGATTADFKLQVQLKDGEVYKFQYPVTVVAQYQGGPLQGAIHWAAEDSGATQTFVLQSPRQMQNIPLQVSNKCDYSNRPDKGCSDFVYIKIFNNGERSKPVAKKRFYLKVIPN